jgi:hypothetical protein
LAADRSNGALAPESRLVDAGALCANEGVGSVARRSPNANVGRFIMETWVDGTKVEDEITEQGRGLS